MPSRDIITDNASPSKIVRVSIDEMMLIMKRNSSNKFIPAKMHSNPAGTPIVAHILWVNYPTDILFNSYFLFIFSLSRLIFPYTLRSLVFIILFHPMSVDIF